MDVSRTEAIDAIDDLLSDVQGASEALSLFGAAEGLDLPVMVSRALDHDVDLLRVVEAWLKKDE